MYNITFSGWVYSQELQRYHHSVSSVLFWIANEEVEYGDDDKGN